MHPNRCSLPDHISGCCFSLWLFLLSLAQITSYSIKLTKVPQTKVPKQFNDLHAGVQGLERAHYLPSAQGNRYR